jgi:hypothetical protein
MPGCFLGSDWHAKRVWHVDLVDGHDDHNAAACLNDRGGWQHDQHSARYHYEPQWRRDHPD